MTSDAASTRLALRMAFAATFAFMIAELSDWEFSFLAPMLAVQILAAVPRAPRFGQGIAIPLVIFFASNLALAFSAVFSANPGVLLAVVALVLCLSFYGQRRDVPAVAMLLTQIAFCCVPVMSTISLDLANGFADALLQGSMGAILTVWLSHLVFPASNTPATPAPGSQSGLAAAYAARVAVSDVLVLLPLLFAFVVGGDANNIVILMVSLTLLRGIDPRGTGKTAAALLLGNIVGGALAVLAFQVIRLADGFQYFVLAVLACSLWFAERFARGGPVALVYAVAFATFLLILGMGVSPIPGGSEELFAVRIFKILLASR